MNPYQFRVAPQNFFANTNALVSEWKLTAIESDGKHHFEQAELDLLAKWVFLLLRPQQKKYLTHSLRPFPPRLEQAQISFREALSDSFDTTKALQIILNLVSSSNIYLGRGRALTNVPALSAVAEWVTRMLRMFGLGEGSPVDSNGEKVIGWGQVAVEGQGAGNVSSHILVFWLLVQRC